MADVVTDSTEDALEQVRQVFSLPAEDGPLLAESLVEVIRGQSSRSVASTSRGLGAAGCPLTSESRK
jgi:hypothetical protein